MKLNAVVFWFLVLGVWFWNLGLTTNVFRVQLWDPLGVC